MSDRTKQDIELREPHDGAETYLLRKDWKETARLRAARSGAECIKDDNLAFPLGVNFTWDFAGDAKFQVEIATDPEFRTIVKSISGSTGCSVFNLETGREYFWRVRAVLASGEEVLSSVRHFRTSAETPRLIRVPDSAPVNIRDLGGKNLKNGGRTRQGLVFRGSELDGEYAIAESGREFLLNELKIRTDLDLRYPNQVCSRTSSVLGDTVRWLHRPVDAYQGFTPEQNLIFRDTIKVFADEANYPIYFHCSGGSDRTGEIAFLLNALLGVDEEEALQDYELSSLCFFPRSRTIGYFQKWLAGIAGFAPETDSLLRKVEKYLLAIGITEEDFMVIRNIMTE